MNKMLIRKVSYYKNALILLMMCFVILVECSKNKENTNQHLQQKTNTQIEQKSSELIPVSNNWPSFRGEYASGVSDKQYLPNTWSIKRGEHIKWKVRIPGLAHSSPIIWSDRIFVTTAVSEKEDASFRHGLYGDGDASDDRSIHEWKLYCINKYTGEIIWERLVKKDVPID